MDTLVTISAVSDSSESAEKAIEAAFSEIEKLDALLDFFSEKSEVSDINKNAGVSPVRVSPETLDILERAAYASEKTNGAFDITNGAVTSLWDFSKKIKPEYRAIKEKLRLVNYKDVIIDKNSSSVYLRKRNMLINLGGIAKGYAADMAVEALKNNRIRAGIVSIAGDIKAFGLKPDGKPWRIGIRDPRPKDKDDDLMSTIELTDTAISTSGDYERYFIVNGKRYHHILDPKTGYPASESRSVSIIAKEGSVTDPLSTGIFILGAEKGIKLMEGMGIDGIIIDKDGKIHISQDIRGKIEFKRDN